MNNAPIGLRKGSRRLQVQAAKWSVFAIAGLILVIYSLPGAVQLSAQCHPSQRMEARIKNRKLFDSNESKSLSRLTCMLGRAFMQSKVLPLLV